MSSSSSSPRDEVVREHRATGIIIHASSLVAGVANKDPRCMYLLGMLCIQGHGEDFQGNDGLAADLLRHAAAEGHESAKLQLAMLESDEHAERSLKVLEEYHDSKGSFDDVEFNSGKLCELRYAQLLLELSEGDVADIPEPTCDKVRALLRKVLEHVPDADAMCTLLVLEHEKKKQRRLFLAGRRCTAARHSLARGNRSPLRVNVRLSFVRARRHAKVVRVY